MRTGLRLAVLGIVLGLGLSACGNGSGQTSVKVVVDGRGLTAADQARVTMVQLVIVGDGDAGPAMETFYVKGLVGGEYQAIYKPMTTSGTLVITVTLLDVNGAIVGTNSTQVTVHKGNQAMATVVLGSAADGGVDAVVPPPLEAGVDAPAADLVSTDAPVACAALACSGTVGDGCCPTGCTAATDVDCAGCGNGRLDPGETCDPLTSCPTSCPAVGCQLFTVAQPGTCQAACVAAGAQTACVNGDGCCPTGCTSATDSDCAAACGNGVVDGKELCDGNCPTACPALGCQLRTLQGAAATCDATCVNGAMQTACASGDGCCPGGCTTANDADCGLKCGNGIIETGETCDGNCPATCPSMGCQLRVLQGGAATCDATCVNGAMQKACVNGDGCCPNGCNTTNDTDCRPSCGNGVVETGETCDPPSACTTQMTACVSDANNIRTGTGSAATCNFVCATTPRACGGATDGFCPTGCLPTTDVDCPGCGNGKIEANLGETCDVAPAVTVCTAVSCDDGNACTTDAKTGTAAACNVACTHTAVTACVDGDGCCPASCTAATDNDCVPANDTCATATDISAGGDFGFGLNKANNENTGTCTTVAGDDGTAPDVYFKFTLTTVSDVYLDVYDPSGKAVNVALELYSGACPPTAALSLRTCDATDGGNCTAGVNWPRIFSLSEKPGSYFVVARVLNKLPGRYTLRFQRVPQTCVAAGALPALPGMVVSTTCDTAVNEYAPSCGGGTDAEDKTYYLEKCPGPGLNLDTCAGRTGNTDTILELNMGSMDQDANMRCAVTTTGTAVACNDDAPAGSCSTMVSTNVHTSLISNAGRTGRGIFEITVDEHPSTVAGAAAPAQCGVFGLNASLTP